VSYWPVGGKTYINVWFELSAYVLASVFNLTICFVAFVNVFVLISRKEKKSDKKEKERKEEGKEESVLKKRERSKLLTFLP
jgi:hypothetical protein